MSDFTIPLRAGNVPSLFGAMQQYGQAQQSLLEPLRTQQATQLIAQQVQAARIQNLRAGLQYSLADQLYNSIGGSGGGGYDPNAAASGMPGGGASFPAGGNGQVGSATGGLSPSQSVPAGGAPAVPGSAPTGAAGPGPGAPGPGGPAAGPAQPPTLGTYQVPSPDLNNGAAISPFGTPAPRVRLMMAMLSDNPAQQLSQIFNDGRQRVTQVMSFAQAPAQIKQAAYRLYGEGWLDRDQYAAIYANPTTAARQQLLDAQASPDEQVKKFVSLTGIGLQSDPTTGGVMPNPQAIAGQAALAGAKAGSVKGAELPYVAPAALAGHAGEMVTVKVPGPGNTFREQQAMRMPDGSIVGLNGQPLAGAVPIAGAAASPSLSQLPPDQQAMVQRVAGATGQPVEIIARQKLNESGTSANPAAGDGGKSIGVMQVQQPALDDYNKAHGTHFTLDQLQAMPELGLQVGTEIRGAYAQQFGNNPVLGAMAYNWGPQKVAAWQAGGSDPNAVPPAVQQYVRSMYGPNAMGMAQAPASPPGGPGVTAPPAVGASTTIAPPAVGGIGAGAPQWTQQQQAAFDVDKGKQTADQGIVADAQTAAMKAQGAGEVVLDLRQRAAADPAAFGSAGDWRTSIGNALATFGPQWTQQFTKYLTDNKIDPNSTPGRQAMAKEFFSLVTGAEQQLGGRPGAMLTQYFSKAMPNINMQGDAVKEMLNFVLVGNQMTRDYAQGAADHFNTASAAFPAQDPVAQRYSPLTQFDEKWTAPGAVSAPNVYEAASNILNGRAYDQWSKGLTRAQAADQQAEAIRIALRADPSFRLGAGQLPPRPAPTGQ